MDLNLKEIDNNYEDDNKSNLDNLDSFYLDSPSCKEGGEIELGVEPAARTQR